MDVVGETSREQPKARSERWARLAALAVCSSAVLVLAATLAVSAASATRVSLVRGALTIALTSLLAYRQVRHPVAVAALTIAPLPGAAMTIAAPHLAGPAAGTLIAAIVYAGGISAALLAMDSQISLILSGVAPLPSVFRVWREFAPVAMSFLVVGALLPCCLALTVGQPFRHDAYRLALGNVLAIGLGMTFPPAVASFCDWNETLIAVLNRGREFWGRCLERIVALTDVPWSISGAGILLVFLVTEGFGVANLRQTEGHLAAIPMVALLSVLAGAAYAAARDWRWALSIWLSTVGCGAMALWLCARFGGTFDPATALALAAVSVVCFMPVVSMTPPAVRGTEIPERRTALMREGPAVLSITATSLCVLAANLGNAGVTPWAALAAVGFAAPAAFLFKPGMTALLEICIPRRSALEERYRLK